jgi:hypothetical protein
MSKYVELSFFDKMHGCLAVGLLAFAVIWPNIAAEILFFIACFFIFLGRVL